MCPSTPAFTRPADRADAVTAAAGGLAAGVAVLYFIVGFEIVDVFPAAAATTGPIVPLVVAGTLFGVLALFLALRPRAGVMLAGAGLQVLVLLGYVLVAAERDPAFEAWGLTIKALQVVLLAMLVAEALHLLRERRW